MIFRTYDGDFIEINKNDYTQKTEYLEAIMDIFNIKQQLVGIRDDINQLDMFYNITSNKNIKPSKL